MSTNNTYAGNTTLNAGALEISRATTANLNPFGTSGNLYLNGGTLSGCYQLANNEPFASNPYFIGGSGSIGLGDTAYGGSASGALIGNGWITVPNPTIYVASIGAGAQGNWQLGGSNASYWTQLYDNGNGFTKDGPGTLVLGGMVLQNAAPAISGVITVNGGTLQFGATTNNTFICLGTPSVIVNNSGIAKIALSDSLWRTDVTLNGASSSLTIQNSGVGYIALLGGLQGGTSATNVDLGPGSQSALNNGFNFDVGYNNLNETFNGNFIDTNSTPYSNVVKTGSGNWTLTGQSTITGASGWKTPAGTYYYVPGTTAYAPSFVLMGGSLTLGANGDTVNGGPVGKGPLFIAPLSGGGAASGGGPVTLTSNSPSGYTIANPVIFGNAATGGSTGSATLGDASNDALTLSGNVTLASFNYGTKVVAGPLALTLTTPGNGVTISGNIGEDPSGVGSSIVKTGAGTLVFTGTNSYTGGTNIQMGTLQAAMPVSLPGFGTANTIIGSGATLAVNAGGVGQWQAADLDNLLNNARFYFDGSSNLAIDTTGGNFTYNTGVTSPVPLGFTKQGVNTLILGGANFYNGPTTITAGTLQLNDGATLGTALVTNNGGLVFNYSTGTTTVPNNITGTGTLTKSGASTVILTGSSLSTGLTTITAGTVKVIGGSGLLSNVISASGGLDIQGGQAVLDYTSLYNTVVDGITINQQNVSTLAELALATSYGSNWQVLPSFPLGSTTAYNDYLTTHTHALGWTNVYDPVSGDYTLTIAYTLYGDANLDGTVNGGDLNTVLSNFQQTGVWAQGDFNYDGTVNGADLNMVLSNFQQHVSVTGAVPEPSSLLLIAAGLAGLLAYAWRKRK